MSISTKRGFTLIELLVVIAIIGLLASVVIASLSSARAKGRDARRLADLKSIQLANELFFDANGQYASSTASLAPTYITKVPVDPGNQGAYWYVPLDTNSTAGTCESYHLGATLEAVSGSAGVLANDADAAAGTACTNPASATDVSGVAAPCGTAGSPDTCYDLKP